MHHKTQLQLSFLFRCEPAPISLSLREKSDLLMRCLCRCTCPSWWLRSCDQAVPSCLCPASALWSSPWRDEWEWARSGRSPCLVWHAPHGCSTSCGTPGSPCPHGHGNGPSQWQPHHPDELETARTAYLARRSLLKGALMILRRMWDGAVKCALRFFLREEETLAFSFMAANWTLGYLQGLQGLTTSPMIADQAKNTSRRIRNQTYVWIHMIRLVQHAAFHYHVLEKELTSLYLVWESTPGFSMCALIEMKTYQTSSIKNCPMCMQNSSRQSTEHGSCHKSMWLHFPRTWNMYQKQTRHL